MAVDHHKLYRDIAQARSVSRGATMNGVSQSAASQYLQELERSLDVALLDRSTRPLALTAGGKLYLEFCRDVLRRREEFDVALGELKSEVAGLVRVASIYSVGLSEMSHLESVFGQRFPQARLEVEYLRPEKVYEAVRTDAVDLGLVSYPEPTKEIVVIPWREEQMVVAVAPAHPLSSHPGVTPADLDGLDFVAFDEDLPIRRDIDRFLREQKVEVSVEMHFDNLEMVKEAVALGSGVSIVPERILRTEVEQGRIVAIPLSSPGLIRPLGIVHRRRKKFTRAGQALLALLQEPEEQARA